MNKEEIVIVKCEDCDKNSFCFYRHLPVANDQCDNYKKRVNHLLSEFK